MRTATDGGSVDSLWELAATDARDAIAVGDITSEALVRATLEHIVATDGSLKAFITVCPEQAVADARAIDERRRAGGLPRLLEGVPFAVKDLTDTAGVRTTFGSTLHADRVPSKDEIWVARLHAAGDILVGKTNTPEFGFGARCSNTLCGPTANPYDLHCSSGASSGGSAAAVAAGLAPLAHGTDFAGSVRTPASFCGVVGFRPTPGLVPILGEPSAWNALITQGMLARNVADAALMRRVTAGGDARDPISQPGDGSWQDEDIGDEIRVARSSDLGVAPVSCAVRDAFDAAARAIAGRLRCTEVASPDCQGAVEAFATLRAAIAYRRYSEVVAAHRDVVSDAPVWDVGQGEGLSAAQVMRAEAVRTHIYANAIEFFTRADVLVTPAAAVAPFSNAESEVLEIDGTPLASPIAFLAITSVISWLGLPCLSIPSGIMVDGMPFGLQLVAPPFHEGWLLAIARLLERDLGFRHRWPKVPDA